MAKSIKSLVRAVYPNACLFYNTYDDVHKYIILAEPLPRFKKVKNHYEMDCSWWRSEYLGSSKIPHLSIWVDTETKAWNYAWNQISQECLRKLSV